MQDINNKLKEILEKLTDFFENFMDEMTGVKTNERPPQFPICRPSSRSRIP